MGHKLYTHTLQIPVSTFSATVGTWAVNLNSGLVCLDKTDGDDTSVVGIPLPIPRRQDNVGVIIKKITIPARVDTADLDAAPTLVLYRNNFDGVVTGATADATTTTIAETAGAGVVVTADANDRLWEFTIDTPDIDLDDEALATYHALLTINAAATSGVRLYDAIVTYDSI